MCQPVSELVCKDKDIQFSAKSFSNKYSESAESPYRKALHETEILKYLPQTCKNQNLNSNFTFIRRDVSLFGTAYILFVLRSCIHV